MPTMPPHASLSLRQLSERGERPFPSHPQVARYFPAANIEEARRRLIRVIDRGEGPALVISAAGMGKSLLLQALAAHYQRRFDVVLLACARLCSCRALLQAVLFELGLPYRLRDEGRLRFSLLDHLLAAKQSSELLLLVDEAQSLSVPLLDELRVMTNLIRDGAPRVRLVLAGLPPLEECFAGPEMDSFSQRLAARCYLTPFTRDETIQFVRAQFAACGAAVDDIVGGDALEAVFAATDGVPRLINQLCDRALLLAGEENVTCIDRRIIQTAWSDMQQLPVPWEPRPADPRSSEHVVEFGQLDAAPPLMAAMPAAPSPAATLAAWETSNSNARTGEPERPRHAASQQAEVARWPAEAARQIPFEDSFDEEELVLDKFAAWSELLHPLTPRVENRRDVQFSAMVEAASQSRPEALNGLDDDVIAAPLPTLAPPGECAEPTPAAIERPSILIDGWEVTELEATEDAAKGVEDADWRPLRLAFADAPAEGSSPWEDDASFPPTAPHEESNAADSKPDKVAAEEPPILVIEDDLAFDAPAGIPAARLAAACPPGQVERHEYRRLFSRLRSG
jgi:type II secretory pathway predicted ATPase ExeA